MSSLSSASPSAPQERRRWLDRSLSRHHPYLTAPANKAHHDSLTLTDRIAILITDRVGTFAFFLLVQGVTILWVLWNTVLPGNHFDPGPAFVLLLLGSNFVQLALMPLIMVGQNLQSRHSDLRAEHDYVVNVKAEQEVEELRAHLARHEALLTHIVALLEEKSSSSTQ